MPVIVYNNSKETHDGPNNFYIGRPSVLGNPYTDKPLSGTMAIFQAKTREEAIEKYEDYFDIQYGHNIEFTKAIDEIYEKYKNGETVYLECYCKPLPCHGDVIVKKLRQRLLKEKISEARKNRNK